MTSSDQHTDAGLERPHQLHPPLEMLAAWIDGRLAEAERARTTRHLADCERCRETVAEASLALGEAGSVEAVDPTEHALVPPAVGGSWIRLAVAAVFAVVVLAGLWSFFAPPPATNALTNVAVELARNPEVAGIYEDPSVAHGWSVLRGVPGSLDAATRDFRLGVLSTDLELAMAWQERPGLDHALTQYRQLAGTTELAEPILAAIDEIERSVGRQESDEARRWLATSLELLQQVVDGDTLETGRTAERLRLLALSRDPSALDALAKGIGTLRRHLEGIDRPELAERFAPPVTMGNDLQQSLERLISELGSA